MIQIFLLGYSSANMEYLDAEETRSVFDELKNSINSFYKKYSELDTNGTIDMMQILRNCEKMDHFLNSDFYQLWRLEQEDRVKLAKKLEAIPLESAKPPEVTRRGSESSQESEDSCASMPPLVSHIPQRRKSCSSEAQLEQYDLQNSVSSEIMTSPNEVHFTAPPTQNLPVFVNNPECVNYDRHGLWNFNPGTSVLDAIDFSKTVLDYRTTC